METKYRLRKVLAAQPLEAEDVMEASGAHVPRGGGLFLEVECAVCSLAQLGSLVTEEKRRDFLKFWME